MPTELDSEELIPGATKFSSDSSQQVGTDHSSGWLGGTMAAASESPLVTYNDLPVGGITLQYLLAIMNPFYLMLLILVMLWRHMNKFYKRCQQIQV